MFKKLSISLVVLILAVSATFTSVSAAPPTDVKGHWAEKQISELVSGKIINGFPDGSFRPEDSITRAEFIQIVANMFPYNTASSSFKDVNKSIWYYDAISKGVQNGIVKGFPDNTFRPNQNISRQDIAVILDRVLQQEGDYKKEVANSFKDSEDVNSYATQAINRMVAYGLVYGKTQTEFKPNDMAKRAEAATMIYRAIALFESTPAPAPSPEPAPSPTPEPTPEPEVKHYRDMTLEELKAEYGTRILVERIDGYYAGGGIVTRDLLDRYYEELHGGYGDIIPDPVTYMAEKEEQIKSLHGHYSSWYPKYEIISYRGKSFVDSVLYEEGRIPNFNVLKFMDISILPSNPQTTGHILVDLHTYSDQYGIYFHNDTKVGAMSGLMYQSNSTWMADVKNVLKHLATVTQSDSKLTLKNGSNTVELTTNSKAVKVNGVVAPSLSETVQIKNNIVFVPLREVSDYLGLSTRAYEKGIGRIEVANYPLASDYK